MGLPQYDNANNLFQEITERAKLVQSHEALTSFEQQRKTLASRKDPQKRELLLKEIRDSFIQAYQRHEVAYTDRGVDLIARMDLVRTGMPSELMWESPSALFLEIVAVFEEFKKEVHWHHHAARQRYYLGNGIIGYQRLLSKERKIPAETLLIEDTLDFIWAEKSDESVIFIAPKELLIIGSDRRELTIAVYCPICFDRSKKTWLLFDGELIEDQFKAVRPSTLNAAKKTISKYTGPSTAGSLDNPEILALATELGFDIRNIDGVLAAVLEPKKRKGFQI